MTDYAGGQAVIEGVMMRKKDKLATAVRLPNGKIKIKKANLKKRSKFWKLPFLRGMMALWDMLIIGMRSLLWSADQQLEEHEKITKKEVLFTVIISLTAGILLFVVLPYFLTFLLGFKEIEKPIAFNAIDGLIKAAMFIAYIYLISFMKDVKRLFQYHGAEHKTIYCYEDKKKLIYKNVKPYTTLHPRCGTSFIFLVLTISLFVFAVIPSLIIFLWPGLKLLTPLAQRGVLLPVRLLFMPIIAGIGFEVLKLSAKFQDKAIFQPIIKPGLWLQKITTKEPDKKQIEVAIAALHAVK